MLSLLLESKARPSGSPVGIAMSLGAHLIVVVAAVHATAQSRPRAAQVTTMVLPRLVREQPRTERRQQRQKGEASNPRVPAPVHPLRIDLRIPSIPSIDLIPPAATAPTDFSSGGLSSTTGSETVTSNTQGVFRADQVERQVRLLAGSGSPRYPEALRNAGIEGKVLVQFTVNELGFVEPDSVRFVQSDNVLFEESVRSALQRMRFVPAEVAGRKVRQLVQMPFVFTLTGR